VALLLAAAWAPVSDAGRPRTREAEKWEAMAGYTGTQACIDCHEHEERGALFKRTLHGRSDRGNWAGGVGCEACHGPGEGHIAGKGKKGRTLMFDDLPAREVNDICLACHETGDHGAWRTGSHDARGLTCLSCHQIHQEEPAKGLLKKPTEFETCTDCHRMKKSALYKSAHMPLREGGMSCSSCHDPHGGNGPSQLIQFSVNENCYSCHAEKRSPVLWEHLPVRESCTSCHDPHGSLHRGMLTARVPRLCQQCHDEARHPTQPYDSARDDVFFPGSRLFGRGCMNCHPAVHGSNHPSGVRLQR
jgi:DmsE family decaheme c-type cytochrome